MWKEQGMYNNNTVLFTTKGSNKDSVVKSFVIAAICVLIGIVVVTFVNEHDVRPGIGLDEGERAFASSMIVTFSLAPFFFAVASVAKGIIDNCRYMELYQDHIEGRKVAKNNGGYHDIYLRLEQISNVSVERGKYICVNVAGETYKVRSSNASAFMNAYRTVYNQYFNR